MINARPLWGRTPTPTPLKRGAFVEHALTKGRVVHTPSGKCCGQGVCITRPGQGVCYAHAPAVGAKVETLAPTVCAWSFQAARKLQAMYIKPGMCYVHPYKVLPPAGERTLCGLEGPVAPLSGWTFQPFGGQLGPLGPTQLLIGLVPLSQAAWTFQAAWKVQEGHMYICTYALPGRVQARQLALRYKLSTDCLACASARQIFLVC